MNIYKEAGWKPKRGFQLRYIYFLNPTVKERLTVPILPFSKIDEMGARMYLGKQIDALEVGDVPNQGNSGGPTPTPALQSVAKV